MFPKNQLSHYWFLSLAVAVQELPRSFGTAKNSNNVFPWRFLGRETRPFFEQQSHYRLISDISYSLKRRRIADIPPVDVRPRI